MYLHESPSSTINSLCELIRHGRSSSHSPGVRPEAIRGNALYLGAGRCCFWLCESVEGRAPDLHLFPQSPVPCCSVNPQQLLYFAGYIFLTPADLCCDCPVKAPVVRGPLSLYYRFITIAGRRYYVGFTRIGSTCTFSGSYTLIRVGTVEIVPPRKRKACWWEYSHVGWLNTSPRASRHNI